MAKASLPFWNDGKPFEPQVFRQDVAQYADQETKLMAPVVEARAALRDAEALVQDLLESKAKKVDVAKAQRARDQAQAAFHAADQAAKDPMLALQADFIAETLRRCTPPLDKPLKLTVAQTRAGFHAVWDASHDWRADAEAPRPLADAGGTSAPSPSPA